MKQVTAMFCITGSMFISTARAEVKVIYGKDNRMEVERASQWVQTLARSAATLISEKDLSRDEKRPGMVKINQRSLKQWLESMKQEEAPAKFMSKDVVDAAKTGVSFCKGERFVNQPNPGVCSGFLIAPDLIATAGHCVQIENFCEEYRWVFDFKVDSKTGKSGLNVKENDVYKCKKVVSNALSAVLNLDYAVIQLDRFVEGRQPVKILNDKDVEDSTKLILIGSPSGLPLKVAGGAAVRTNSHPFFFSANLDAFQGNSGSAVFDANTGIVQGILVRGENDFIPNPILQCIQSNKCENNECRGEDVSRMTSIPEVALMKPLFTAAFEGDIVMLEKILKFNFWVDFYDFNRQSALMKAARGGKGKALSMLLARGADVNLIDVNGNTVLHHLAASLNDDNADALGVLIAANVNLEAKNFSGETALKLAGKMRNSVAAKLLIKAGSDKNTVNKLGETILFDFAKDGQTAEFKEMLDLGVNPEIKNTMGFKAI